MALLRAMNGVNPGKLFPVGDSAVLGRHPDCGIVLDVGAVSRQHARITKSGEVRRSATRHQGESGSSWRTSGTGAGWRSLVDTVGRGFYSGTPSARSVGRPPARAAHLPTVNGAPGPLEAIRGRRRSRPEMRRL